MIRMLTEPTQTAATSPTPSGPEAEHPQPPQAGAQPHGGHGQQQRELGHALKDRDDAEPARRVGEAEGTVAEVTHGPEHGHAEEPEDEQRDEIGESRRAAAALHAVGAPAMVEDAHERNDADHAQVADELRHHRGVQCAGRPELLLVRQPAPATCEVS
jgi:hypothetical protein